MFDNKVSLFRCVALGTASENKKLGSVELAITPHEKTPFIDGEIVDRVETLEFDSVNQSGSPLAGNAFVSTSVIAHWLPSTNRRTPPDVQRGEMVRLWQMAGEDKYYWTSLGKDDRLRRLETVVVGISANPDPDADGTSLDNMYFLEISSHNRTVTFSTSQMNEEFCTYNFQFDLANGKVVLEDSLDNYLLFDSQNTNIRAENNQGTSLELNKKNINLNAPDSITGVATNNIKLQAKNNIDILAQVVNINGGGSQLTLEAGGTTLKTPNFKGVS